MPLVSCPECQGQVSTAAASCPHCGHPLRGGAGGGVAAVYGAAAATPFAAGAAAPAAEDVVWQAAPSLRALAVDGLRTAVAAAIVIVAVTQLYDPILSFVAGISDDGANLVASSESKFRLAAISIVVVSIGTRLARLGWRGLSLRSQRYRLSNQRLVVESGVMAKAIDEIDMRTVDDVLLRQTVTQRLLGIGEITIVSSEPGASRPRATVRLLGIRDPRAVRELVRGSAYQATRNQIFTRST
jgi:Bacterial PH domain